jgi:hypothetical protein
MQPPQLTPGGVENGATCPFEANQMSSIFDAKCNWGNEQNDKMRKDGVARIARFCNWARKQTATKFVLVGHSSWLMQLYRNYYGGSDRVLGYRPEKKKLPTLRTLDDKKETAALNLEDLMRSNRQKIKVDNAGVVTFQLRVGGPEACEVVPGSTELVYGNLAFSDKKNVPSGKDEGHPAPIPKVNENIV